MDAEGQKEALKRALGNIKQAGRRARVSSLLGEDGDVTVTVGFDGDEQTDPVVAPTDAEDDDEEDG